jgi:hypothetical protein
MELKQKRPRSDGRRHAVAEIPGGVQAFESAVKEAKVPKR